MTLSSDREYQSRKYKDIFPLLVEGNDDLYITSSLADFNKLPYRFYAHPCGGYPKITVDLDTRLNIGDYHKLGIVIDADTNISEKWGRLKEILEKYGYEIGEKPNGKGIITEKEGKKVGLWVMPDNQSEGELEDFYRGFIPTDDSLITMVKETLDKLENQGLNRYKKRNKAFVHTWLAWQEDSGMPMGKSIKNYPRLLKLDSASDYINWLKTLFEDEVRPASIS